MVIDVPTDAFTLTKSTSKTHLLVAEKTFLLWKSETGKLIKDGSPHRVTGEEVSLTFIRFPHQVSISSHQHKQSSSLTKFLSTILSFQKLVFQFLGKATKLQFLSKSGKVYYMRLISDWIQLYLWKLSLMTLLGLTVIVVTHSLLSG